MPQWAGSCWYYLRYLDPKNNNEFCNKNIEQYWMSPDGVDLYIGGSEHAVLHLLYARFWHKVLFDYGYVSSVEPFKKLFHQGLIMGEDGRKMSKSLSNVINPDDVVNNYGADSLRIFEMFLGPLEASKPWSTTGIEGVNRFLNRVWRLFTDNKGNLSDCIADIPLTAEQDYMLNFTIKKVADDIESLNFNTAISHMMIFVNEFTKAEIKPLSALNKFVLCLAPFAPHLAEELWRLLGNETSVVTESFPVYDQSKIIRNNIEFVIQVNSKIRSKISVPINSSQEEIETLAKLDDKVIKYINGKIINKVIFVPNKLLNYITS
jgi:leucyl-tRNA synthetase